MVTMIAWVSLAAAAVLFVVGVVDLAQSWGRTEQTKEALKEGTQKLKEVSADKSTLEEYASVDVKGTWEALAKLATALKDLDRSSRLFTLSLAFLAVAGATVGLDAIGSGLAAATGS
jgi:exopolyphosphatase/pppGpp-phosphohydrolase